MTRFWSDVVWYNLTLSNFVWLSLTMSDLKLIQYNSVCCLRPPLFTRILSYSNIVCYREDTDRWMEYMAQHTTYFDENEALYRCFQGNCYGPSAITSAFGNCVVDNWHSRRGFKTHFMCSYTLEGATTTKQRRMDAIKKNAEGYARRRKTCLVAEGSVDTAQLGVSCHHADGNHWIPIIFMVSNFWLSNSPFQPIFCLPYILYLTHSLTQSELVWRSLT